MIEFIQQWKGLPISSLNPEQKTEHPITLKWKAAAAGCTFSRVFGETKVLLFSFLEKHFRSFGIYINGLLNTFAFKNIGGLGT